MLKCFSYYTLRYNQSSGDNEVDDDDDDDDFVKNTSLLDLPATILRDKSCSRSSLGSGNAKPDYWQILFTQWSSTCTPAKLYNNAIHNTKSQSHTKSMPKIPKVFSTKCKGEVIYHSCCQLYNRIPFRAICQTDGWDGMDNMGHRSSKSTFGTNNVMDKKASLPDIQRWTIGWLPIPGIGSHPGLL